MKTRVDTYGAFLCWALLNFCCSSFLFAQETGRLYIGSQFISGNEKTNTGFLEELIEIGPGDSVSKEFLNERLFFIKRLPSVWNATWKYSESSSTLTWDIEERKTLIPEFNIWHSRERTWLRIGLYEHNFRQRASTLGGFYQYTGYHNYGATFRAPFFFGRRWGLVLNQELWTSEEPVYFDGRAATDPAYTANYRYRNLSGQAGVIYQPRINHLIEQSVTFFNEDYLYLSGADSVLERPNLNTNKFLVKNFYHLDKTEWDYQYLSKGQLFVISQYVYTPAKSEHFFQWHLEGRYFWRIGKFGNLGIRGILGIATNNDSPFAPFVVDHHTGTRGIGDRIARGSGIGVINIEFRENILENNWINVQAVGFIDQSYLRRGGGDLSDVLERDNGFYTAGAGLRINLKQYFGAVFRVDYGFEIAGSARKGLVLGLGQYF